MGPTTIVGLFKLHGLHTYLSRSSPSMTSEAVGPQGLRAFKKGSTFKSRTHTYTCGMGTKNIAISDEAYERLKALKRPGESFTELIERMTQSRSVVDLAGLLTKGEGLEVKERVSELRKSSSRRLSETEERLS